MSETARDSDGAEAAEPAVSAADLGLDGPRGPVFTGIRFEAPPGSVVALEGPSGTGRTCLLLALTGRMKTTAGHALVEGRRLPRQLAAVRRISALAAVPGITDLEPSLSVAEQLRERELLQRRFGGSLRTLLRPRGERAAASRERTGRALAAAGLDLEDLPKGPRTRVRDLERLESLRLSVALALTGGPRVLGVDDVDLKLTGAERDQAWELLRSVASSGVTVLAACTEAPPGAVAVPMQTETGSTRRRPAPAGDSGTTSEEGAADALAGTGRA